VQSNTDFVAGMGPCLRRGDAGVIVGAGTALQCNLLGSHLRESYPFKRGRVLLLRNV